MIDDIVQGLRDQAGELSDGPMASIMEQRIEWQAADAITDLLAEITVLTTEKAHLLRMLQKIANSADDGGQDQLAPDMWRFCRDIANGALADLGEDLV